LVVFGEFALYALGESLELKILKLVVERTVEFIDVEAKALVWYGKYRVLDRVLPK
jgi:hypothetical protein